MKHGLITFLIALVYIYLGFTGWPSDVNRGLTEPGYYESQQLRVTGDGPKRYDFFTEQVKRKQERGR